MRHYQTTTTGTSYGSSFNPLLEQVFSILDSRIQFIDHQVQRYFSSCTADFSSSPSSSIQYSGPTISGLLVDNFDQLLSFTEKLQNDLKLLQILKAWLNEDSVQEILDLLTNNKYLNYSEENLEHLLKEKVLVYYPVEQFS